jgi:acyl-coenzyme A synthetase/AMP-(fatty) acid ligase
MVPAEAISLEAMPTNQNGKIDRHVLASMANGGEGR